MRPARQRGQAVASGLPIKSLPPGGLARAGDLKGATTIQLSPNQVRTPAARRFPWRNRSHAHSTQTHGTQTHGTQTHGTQKYGWAGAATPTQRNTTPPQIPPRKDSAMLNATPVLGKDKTRWPIGNATETKSHSKVAIFAGLAAWLGDMRHRAGERLFMSCDEEACWRGWEGNQLRGGRGRRDRAPPFHARRADARHLATLD